MPLTSSEAAFAAVAACAWKSFGCVASRNSGAGREPSMRKAPISTPKNRAFSPASWLRKAMACRCSSRKDTAIQTTVPASVLAA